MSSKTQSSVGSFPRAEKEHQQNEHAHDGGCDGDGIQRRNHVAYP
jgi:hypothetical protein